MSRTSWRQVAPIALAIGAILAGLLGAAAPASAAQLKSASSRTVTTPAADRVLVTETFPFPQATDTFQTQSPLVTGPDGALWFLHGTDDVGRMTTDGVYTRFAAYPPGGLSWVGAHLVRDDRGGFLYVVAVGEAYVPHVMHIALNGAVSEIPQPEGTTLTGGLIAGSDGTAWYEASSAQDSATSDIVVRVAHGVARPFAVAGDAYSIVPTDDGGAWVGVRGSLTRIAPDGTVTVPPGVAGRVASNLWPGTGNSLWYVGGIVGDSVGRVGLVQADGSVVERPLGAGVSLLPGTQQAQRSETWINVVKQDGSQAVYVGTTPANLRPIPLSVSSAQLFTGIESGGRLWIVDHSVTSDGKLMSRILSLGVDGSVQDRAELSDGQFWPLAAEPDGTILLTGDTVRGGDIPGASQVLALRPDGALLRGAVDDTAVFRAAFDAQGRPWFVTRTGIATVGDATAERLGGGDRYEAAVAIARAAFPSGAPVLYVASGENFPDALSAGPLAAASHGPLLLTLGGALPAATRAGIVTLAPSKIVVVGGPAAVSDAVVAQLRKLAPTVQRVSGPDRYAVSRGIVAANQHPGKPLFVATGMGYADAVTAGAAAARSGGQLLLVPGGWAGLPAGYASFIRGLHPSSIAVVGGPVAVSDGILAGLRGIAATTRYGGADRYAVSAAVLKGFGTPSTHIYLTTGQNFPDALAAAPLAGRTGATLATVPGGCVPVDTFRAIQRLRPTSVTILGGTSAVGADVAWLRNC